MSRHNVTNRLHHDANEKAANQLFGFQSFDETICYIKAFFTKIEIKFQIISFENKKIVIKPSFLTECEQMLICKLFMQAFPHRTKSALIVGVSRQTTTHVLGKWAPMWATCGSCLSMLPTHHDHYEIELPQDCAENNLNKVSHLFDGKDIIIETPRKMII